MFAVLAWVQALGSRNVFSSNSVDAHPRMLASRRPGASMNDVTDERLFDAASGTSVLDGVPVRLEAATEPTAPARS